MCRSKALSTCALCQRSLWRPGLSRLALQDPLSIAESVVQVRSVDDEEFELIEACLAEAAAKASAASARVAFLEARSARTSTSRDRNAARLPCAVLDGGDEELVLDAEGQWVPCYSTEVEMPAEAQVIHGPGPVVQAPAPIGPDSGAV